MPRNKTSSETQTINTATRNRVSFCVGNLTLSGYDMTIELNQITGFQLSDNLYKPVIDNFVCPFHIFVVPHLSENSVFELVNHANNALCSILENLGPNSKVKVILLERKQVTNDVRVLLGEILPKVTTEVKTSEVVAKIAKSPSLITLLKQALNCRAKTKDGVPLSALKKLLGTNSPSESKISSIVKSAQREEKWDQTAKKLGLPRYSDLLKVLGPIAGATDSVNFRLDLVSFNSTELSELCKEVMLNPSVLTSSSVKEDN